MFLRLVPKADRPDAGTRSPLPNRMELRETDDCQVISFPSSGWMFAARPCGGLRHLWGLDRRLRVRIAATNRRGSTTLPHRAASWEALIFDRNPAETRQMSRYFPYQACLRNGPGDGDNRPPAASNVLIGSTHSASDNRSSSAVSPLRNAIVTIGFANCARGISTHPALPGASCVTREPNLGRRAGTFCDGPTLAGRAVSRIIETYDGRWRGRLAAPATGCGVARA